MKNLFRYVLLVSILILKLTPSEGLAEDSESATATSAAIKSVVDQWIKRSEEAHKKHKDLMALKTKTPRQECEANIERAYLTAGVLLSSQKEKKLKDLDYVMFGFGTSVESIVALKYHYRIKGEFKAKVQQVEAIGKFYEDNKVIFGGEFVHKGDIVLKVGNCVFLLNDSSPLEYKIISH